MSRRRTWTLGRRDALGAVATGLVGTLGGCSLEPSLPDADVVVGPDGAAVFEPAELTVAVGEPVRWGFATAGHNVSCRPADSERAALPDDADPFASYTPGEHPQSTLVPRGGTYEHTFDVAGTYVYVCVPHAERGMVGRVRVQ